MRVTRKGQVTIPLWLREKHGIGLETEVDFYEVGGKIVLKKRAGRDRQLRRIRSVRGAATVRMTTEQILKLTRT